MASRRSTPVAGATAAPGSGSCSSTEPGASWPGAKAPRIRPRASPFPESEACAAGQRLAGEIRHLRTLRSFGDA